jgi:hypothetical protein
MLSAPFPASIPPTGPWQSERHLAQLHRAAAAVGCGVQGRFRPAPCQPVQVPS